MWRGRGLFGCGVARKRTKRGTTALPEAILAATTASWSAVAST